MRVDYGLIQDIKTSHHESITIRNQPTELVNNNALTSTVFKWVKITCSGTTNIAGCLYFLAFTCYRKSPHSHFWSHDYLFIVCKWFVVGNKINNGGQLVHSCLSLGETILKPKCFEGIYSTSNRFWKECGIPFIDNQLDVQPSTSVIAFKIFFGN